MNERCHRLVVALTDVERDRLHAVCRARRVSRPNAVRWLLLNASKLQQESRSQAGVLGYKAALQEVGIIARRLEFAVNTAQWDVCSQMLGELSSLAEFGNEPCAETETVNATV